MKRVYTFIFIFKVHATGYLFLLNITSNLRPVTSNVLLQSSPHEAIKGLINKTNRFILFDVNQSLFDQIS